MALDVTLISSAIMVVSLFRRKIILSPVTTKLSTVHSVHMFTQLPFLLKKFTVDVTA
jgi:hypothetical protein